MKKHLFLLLALCLTFLPGQATAAPQNAPTSADGDVIKTYCAQAYGYAGADVLKADLLLNAKRLAVGELFGELIVASTAVENFVVTSDQIRASSIGFVRIRGSVRYYNGTNLAEVCVSITAYATASDRENFEPVALDKRLCLTDQSMTVSQLRGHVQAEVLVQMLVEYDRRLADTKRETLLQLVRRVVYSESGFAPGTDSYCVTAQAEVIPVEVLALLESVEVAQTASVSTARRTATPTPRVTRTAAQATATPKGVYTPIPAKSQPSARIVVRGADSSWTAPMAESSLAAAIPNDAGPRIFAAYTEALQWILFGPPPAELAETVSTAQVRVRSAYTASHLAFRFVPLPDELLAVLGEIGQ